MMSWLPALPALAVLVAAVCVLLVEHRTERAEAGWLRDVVRRVNPEGYQELADRAAEEVDLTTLEELPEPLRPLCPPPPFVAAVYHHSCGSCRELWRQLAQLPELSAVHMVHGEGQAGLLRRRGVLPEHAIALPDELMEHLPSGLALRIDADWRITDLLLATTVSDLRHLLGEAARSR